MIRFCRDVSTPAPAIAAYWNIVEWVSYASWKLTQETEFDIIQHGYVSIFAADSMKSETGMGHMRKSQTFSPSKREIFRPLQSWLAGITAVGRQFSHALGGGDVERRWAKRSDGAWFWKGGLYHLKLRFKTEKLIVKRLRTIGGSFKIRKAIDRNKWIKPDMDSNRRIACIANASPIPGPLCAIGTNSLENRMICLNKTKTAKYPSLHEKSSQGAVDRRKCPGR